MKFISWNICGSHDYVKVNEILNELKNWKVSVVLLQEVHRLDDDIEFIR